MTRYYLYKVKDTGKIEAKMLKDVSYEDIKKFEFEMQENDNYKILSAIGVEYFLSDIVYLFESLFKELEIPVKFKCGVKNKFYLFPTSSYIAEVKMDNEFYSIIGHVLRQFNVKFTWDVDDIPTLTISDF